MDFIFMLTHNDQTVSNCLKVIDIIENIGIEHIGFKDVGVEEDTLRTLAKKIKEAGATSYMEVVSTTSRGVRGSIRAACRIGVDRVLGGQDIEYAQTALTESGAGYYPFPGRPVGHPTKLEGTPEDIADDCAYMRSAGCPGVDLLAYRATQADPLELVRAARSGLGDGYLIVAGNVDSPTRIQQLADAGVDAFTVGSAVFDATFAPGNSSIAYQCEEILAASRRG